MVHDFLADIISRVGALMQSFSDRNPMRTAVPSQVVCRATKSMPRHASVWGQSGLYIFVAWSNDKPQIVYIGKADHLGRRLRPNSVPGRFRHKNFLEASQHGAVEVFVIPLPVVHLEVIEQDLIAHCSPLLNIAHNPSTILMRAHRRIVMMLRRIRDAEDGIHFSDAATGWGLREAEIALRALVAAGLVRVVHALSKCNRPCRVLYPVY